MRCAGRPFQQVRRAYPGEEGALALLASNNDYRSLVLSGFGMEKGSAGNNGSGCLAQDCIEPDHNCISG